MTTASNIFDQDFDEFLSNCETLMEVATSKDFDKDESLVILLGARHLQQMGQNSVNMFEMDIELNCGDKVAMRRLDEARDCVKAIERIVARMEANVLVCDLNLN